MGGPRSARRVASERREPVVDRDALRRLVLTALRREFRPPKPRVDEEAKHADTRGWLLSALGRLAGDDGEATKEVRRHLDPAYEPNPEGDRGR